MAKLAAVSPETQSNEDLIRRQIDQFAQALRARDLPKMISFYAPDIVAFDMVPPLKYEGLEAYRKSWEKGLSMMEGSIGFDLSDIHIDAGEEVGFARALNHMTFTMEGKKHEMWFRWTAGFRLIGGKWLVTHEHVSVPIDMDTDKGLYNLKP